MPKNNRKPSMASTHTNYCLNLTFPPKNFMINSEASPMHGTSNAMKSQQRMAQKLYAYTEDQVTPKDVHWLLSSLLETDAQKIWRDTTTAAAAADQTYYYGRKKMD
jgi:hypothetical protein